MSWLTLVLLIIGSITGAGAVFVIVVNRLLVRQQKQAEADRFTAPGQVVGVVALSGLPPHRGLILNVCFYRVDGFDSPPPYGAQPPATAATDAHKVCEDVDLEKESNATSREQPFAVPHPTGYYYVEVRAILIRKFDGNLVAQAEQFFYSRRPLLVSEKAEAAMTFPVAWPADNPERLKAFGILKPRSDRPGSAGSVPSSN